MTGVLAPQDPLIGLRGAAWTDIAGVVRLEEESHTYSVGGGQRLVSTTTVLREVGVSVDFERLVREGKLSIEQLTARRDLGRAAHAATHYYDEGTLRAGSVDPRVEPFLDSWIGFREATGFVPAILETALWHPGLLIGGQIDRAGYFSKFADADPLDLITVDLKLGDPDDAGARWQTAAYAEMLAVSLQPLSTSSHIPAFNPAMIRLRPRYSVRLQESGRYKLTRYDDTIRDWMEYTSFVVTYRRQAARRREAA